MIKIGMTIRKLRLERGISQKDLAAAADLTPSFVSLIEHDRREPSIAAITRLAAALDVPPEVIIWDAVQLPDNLTEKDRRLCQVAKLIVRRFYESKQHDKAFKDPTRTARAHSRRARQRP